MSNSEYENCRRALVAEISGTSALPVTTQSTFAEQKAARLMRVEEARKQIELFEKQMQCAPDRLPDDYYAFVQSLQPKFTREVPEQEEWSNACSGPLQEYYNGIAGTTIEEILADKNTVVDSYQNPIGTQFDLPRDAAMQEHTIVLCWFCQEGTYSKPVEALRRKGFKVVVHNANRSTMQQMMVALLSADVLWLISGDKLSEVGFDQLVDAMEMFHRRGGGIFIWGDNAPYYAHANALLSRLFPGEDIYLQGNDHGSQVMQAHSDGRLPGKLARQHLIMTGLRSLFEGVTISYLSRIGPLKVLATYNDGPGYSGKTYCAVADAEVYRRCKAPYKIGRGRIVIDGGFTKLYDEHWQKTAGTERYVKNACAWLLNMNSRLISEGDGDLQRSSWLPPQTHTRSVRNLTYRNNGSKANMAQH
jgi:hypothetical protein